jgi:hypothetical protein
VHLLPQVLLFANHDVGLATCPTGFSQQRQKQLEQALFSRTYLNLSD